MDEAKKKVMVDRAKTGPGSVIVLVGVEGQPICQVSDAGTIEVPESVTEEELKKELGTVYLGPVVAAK